MMVWIWSDCPEMVDYENNFFKYLIYFEVSFDKTLLCINVKHKSPDLGVGIIKHYLKFNAFCSGVSHEPYK